MSLFIALSTAGGYNAQMAVGEAPKIETKLVREISKKEVELIMSTEKYVKQYFSDIPVMIDIAKCESRFRQLEKDGDIHRGELNNEDVGVMQINEHYHLDRSQKENYNIYTLEGNTAYARKLYEKEGTKPWNSSKACWGKSLTASADRSNDLAINK